jgi:ribosome maturation factor RimP
MPKMKTEKIVEKLALPIINKHHLELVDIEFKKEGPGWYLRIYIDKPGGVSLDDCQLISESISEILDEVDPIEQSYYLEVSSPGINRPLKKIEDFERFKDHKIEVKLYAPMNGVKKLIGTLMELKDDIIIMEMDNTDHIKIPLSATASVRLHGEF